MLIKYILSGVFIILGLLTLQYGLRKRSQREIMERKELPVSGRGSKVYTVYLGVAFLILAIIIVLR
jgi:uncharacterized membrane protein YidH (DUF202 family)